MAKLRFCSVEVDKFDKVSCIWRVFNFVNLMAVGSSPKAPSVNVFADLDPRPPSSASDEFSGGCTFSCSIARMDFLGQESPPVGGVYMDVNP